MTTLEGAAIGKSGEQPVQNSLKQVRALSDVLDSQQNHVGHLYQRGYDNAKGATPTPMTSTETSDAWIAYDLQDKTRQAFEQRLLALAEDPEQYGDVRLLAEQDENRFPHSSLGHNARKIAEKARLKKIEPALNFDIAQ